MNEYHPGSGRCIIPFSPVIDLSGPKLLLFPMTLNESRSHKWNIIDKD